MAMMTVSTSPALVWRINSSSVSLAVFSWRRDCPLVRSACVLVDRSRDEVPVRAISNPSCLLETDEDVLDFGVELERMHTQIAADAAALVAAEARFLVIAAAAGGADHAGRDAPALHPRARLHGDQRTDVCPGVERIADVQRAGAGRDQLVELLRDRAMDKGAAAGAAVLARIAEDAVDRGRRGLLELRVRKDDVGRFPPKLERHARDVGRRQLEDGDAGRGLAGKGDLVDTRMAGQRAARAATRAGDHVEHARREAGLERDSPQL